MQKTLNNKASLRASPAKQSQELEIASSQTLRNDIKTMTPLARSILKTLAFFDAQDAPLTLMEIRNYLVNLSLDLSLNPSPGLGRVAEGRERSQALMELKNTLETELADKISFASGFYFLAGRDKLVESRSRRNYRTSLRRMRKSRMVLYFWRYIPYVRAVALSGSQALLASHEDSDIDLLVITRNNRIWLARLFVSLYLQLIGQRRYGFHIKNRFCLNHYISEDAKINQDQNLYTAAEYASLLPVLGKAKLRDFMQRNDWIRKILPGAVFEFQTPLFGFEFSPWQKVFEQVLEITFLGRLLDSAAGWYQRRRIKPSSHIFVSDQELSFHPESKGQEILERFHLTLLRQGFGGQESEEILSGYEKNPPKLQRRSDST